MVKESVEQSNPGGPHREARQPAKVGLTDPQAEAPQAEAPPQTADRTAEDVKERDARQLVPGWEPA